MSVNPVGWIEILAGTICLAAGCLFGYFTIPMLRKRYKLATKGIPANGVITDYERSPLSARFFGGERVTYERIEFQTLEGEKVSFLVEFGVAYGSSGGVRVRDIGTKVKVLYNPKNPQDALDTSFIHFWLIPLCFLAGTFGAFYLSFYLFFGIDPLGLMNL